MFDIEMNENDSQSHLSGACLHRKTSKQKMKRD